MKQREQRRRTAVDTPADTPVNNHYKYITNHKRIRTSADIDRKNTGIRKKQETNFAPLKEAKKKTAYRMHGKLPITPTTPKSHNNRNKKNGYYM